MCVFSWERLLSFASIFNIYFKLYFVHVCVCIPEYMYVHQMHAGACRDQKGALGPQKLELQVIVSCHMGAENQPWMPCKHLGSLSSPTVPILRGTSSSQLSHCSAATEKRLLQEQAAHAKENIKL